MAVEVELGETPNNGMPKPAFMDIDELLATRLLIQGNSGSGKSHLLRRLLEQSAPWVQQIIIDPEGDFVSFQEEYGHVVVEATRSEEELRVIAGRVREKRVSCVLNLESLDADQQMIAAAAFLNGLFDAPREMWYSALVAVDEAQLFAPAASGEVSDIARKASLGAMTNLMCRGRKRGLAGIIATQRLAKLAKNVAAEASNFLMGRTFLDIDMARAADLLGMDRKEAEKFRELGRGHFVALGPALSRKPLEIKVAGVVTKPLGKTPQLTAPPVLSSPEDAQSMILAPVATPERNFPRRQAVAPVVSTDDVLGEIAKKHESDERTVEASASAAPMLDRQAIYRELVAQVMADDKSFYATEANLFQEFQTLVRVRRMGGALPTLAEFRRLHAVFRAGIAHQVFDESPWNQIIELSAQINEDGQALYLMLAKAAVLGEECPSNASIARICGSYSSGRALSRLNALEVDGFLTVKVDFKKRRQVGIPDFGLETLPGDPNGPDAFVPMAYEEPAEDFEDPEIPEPVANNREIDA